jgi:sulfur-oxidizing protein SoxY
MKPDHRKRAALRRKVLFGASGAAAGLVLEATGISGALAQTSPGRSAVAPQSLVAARLAAIQRVTRGAVVSKGKLTLEIPELVDNGNSVTLSVKVDSPMTANNYVKAIHVITEKNPQPDVVSFRFSPRSGRATASTRVRLADTQTVLAICELSDGTFWSGSADTVVTLAACLEEI